MEDVGVAMALFKRAAEKGWCIYGVGLFIYVVFECRVQYMLSNTVVVP